ncbi:hypothetical protein MMC21_003021 [Puttea exsequens]|nr:hypothetical protein [Puttea exsequens]
MGHGRRNSLGPTNILAGIKSTSKRVASNESAPKQFDALSETLDRVHTHTSSISTSASSTSRPNLNPDLSRAASNSTTLTSRSSQASDKKTESLPRRKPHPYDPIAWADEESLNGILPPVSISSTHADRNNSTTSFGMATTVFANGFRSEYGKPPSTSQSNMSFGAGGNNVTVPTPALPPAPAHSGTQNPNVIYQQIHDVASKRISTLDYLRKAHDGHVYWFNTLLISKSDLSRMPYFDPRKLARRATNYLLLGLSLPTVTEVNSSNPQDFLRALNALLTEFESYQQLHPSEGGQASSLSRARIPQMFKRAATSTKGRRTSSAADIGLPMNTSDPTDLKSMSSVATAGSNASSFPVSEQDLLPGEEYSHLLTLSLPFDPDFFETFATLCDVLIDCYTKIMSLIPSPAVCIPGTGEIFGKADSKLRKVILSGIIKEFEDASRAGAKAEFAGLGKVVLGGLM